MIIGPILLAIWAAGLILLPVTIRTRLISGHARNLPGLILIRPDLLVPGAVWAQEYYESRLGWRLLPLHLALFLIGRIVPAWAWYERDMEIMGHEIEVQAEARLTGADKAALRDREANTLAGYRAFRGYLPVTILRQMWMADWAAEDFVNRHWRRIRQQNGNGGGA